jgi:hypothetical protein
MDATEVLEEWEHVMNPDDPQRAAQVVITRDTTMISGKKK